MKIAFFSCESYDHKYFPEQVKQAGHEITFFKAALHQGTLPLAAGHDAVCIFVNDTADRTVLTGLQKQGVKIVALRCAGFNNVDLEAAAELELPIVRVPAYAPEVVAEHTMAIILTLNRKTHKAYNRVREMNFSLHNLEGFMLHGKCIGIIGTGKIGQAFARIVRGFGCKVHCYDPYPNEDFQKEGFKYTELDTLLTESDIISLHCPLVESTYHLIDKAAIKKMRKGVMLINTSRGALVDTKAVIKGLKRQKIGWLGIDVYEEEEGIFFKDLSESILKDDQLALLLTFPNVLVTAHQSFLANEALEEIAETTVINISAFAKGEELVNQVTVG